MTEVEKILLQAAAHGMHAAANAIQAATAEVVATPPLGAMIAAAAEAGSEIVSLPKKAKAAPPLPKLEEKKPEEKKPEEKKPEEKKPEEKKPEEKKPEEKKPEEKKPEEKKPEEKKPEEKKPEEKKPEEKKPTVMENLPGDLVAQARAAAQKYAGIHGRSALRVILDKYTRGSVADVPPNKMPDFLTEIAL